MGRKLLAFVLAITVSACTVVHQPKTADDFLVDHTTASLLHLTGTIEVPFFGVGEYSCTAFVVAPNVALTAAHCIGNDMQADNVPIEKVIKKDDAIDLALISVFTRKPPLAIATVAPPVGARVLAEGYAFGWPAPDRVWTHVIFSDFAPSPEFVPGVFVEPGLHPGMSGGPIVNESGEVVSVCQLAYDGVGYGVTTLIVRAFLLR